MTRILCVTVVAIAGFLSLAALGATSASAHNTGCHRAHAYPGDHATYRWRGWLCVAPYAEETTRRFNRRIRYLGGRIGVDARSPRPATASGGST
jgi:hypothetical protein